jgi:putative Holliday junction resolvase
VKFLGIDYGLSKIGLAISEGELAQPLMVIQNSEKIIGEISKICQKYQIEKLVIGLPEGYLGEKVKEFAGQLLLSTGIVFEFRDETLTTQQALVKMIEAKKKKKIRRSLKDAFAAACILQEYFEERRQDV